jgi:hypothetical protein
MVVAFLERSISRARNRRVGAMRAEPAHAAGRLRRRLMGGVLRGDYGLSDMGVTIATG